MKKAHKASNTNKASLKKTSKKVQHKSLYIALVVTAVFAVIAWLGLEWLNATHGYKLYSQPKHEARQNLVDVAGSLNFSGTSVSNSIEDSGCVETRVGIGAYYNCSFQAKKYYISSGDPSANLHKAHDLLTSGSWKPFEPFDPESYEKFLNGERSGSRSYFSTQGKPGLFLSYYPDNVTRTGDSTSEVLKLAEPINLNKDEYIYGVTVGYAYWSCEDGFLAPKWHCPEPPGPIQNKLQ